MRRPWHTFTRFFPLLYALGVIALGSGFTASGYQRFGLAIYFFGTFTGMGVTTTFELLQRHRIRRVEMRQRRGQCLYCGYDLIGNRSGRCPECATRVGRFQPDEMDPNYEPVSRLIRWHCEDGEAVIEGQPLCEEELFDGTRIVHAWRAGILRRVIEAGTVVVGDVRVARIE